MDMRNPYDWYITPEEYETAAANGISSSTLEARIRRLGWPKERAITEPPRKSKITREIVELAQRNDISYQTLYWRIRSGWAPDRAATEPPLSHAERIKRASDANRKIPAELVDLAKRHGVKYVTFYKRVSEMGWDPVTAATKPPMTRCEIGRLVKAKREIVHKWIFARR